MHRSRITLSFLMLVFLLSPVVKLQANESDRDVKVATYNMYLGADLDEIFGAGSEMELVMEVGEAFTDVQAGLPQERIDEIADQIATGAPDVVGLQEVALWRVGYPGDPASAETVVYDFLQMLLDSLAERGADYAPVAIQTNLDAELTGFFAAAPPMDIRYTDRLVILARTDLQTSRLKIEGTQTGTFETLLPVSILGGDAIYIQRGWASVDIKHRGKTYRFVNAHLEAFYDPVQQAQAYELLLGPTATDLPVILSGDFNSDPVANPGSYFLLLSGGFTDVWSALGSGSGFTWPLSDESPAVILNPYQRVDYIMSRGAVTLSSIDIIGEDATLDLTTSSLRPSDHAGLIATVVLEP